MRYGLPYKGSKNKIAKWIVDNLPEADVFVDLFFGGGAVTHRAMLTGKYKQFIINDIDSRLPKLFVDCAYGKYTVENHPEWVTREEFNARKNEDAYIALVWSFGNNGKDYLFGKDIEDMKHAYHDAVYGNEPERLAPYGFRIEKSSREGVYERYLEFNRQVKKQAPNIQLEVVTRQREIERLQSLQSLQSFGTDYQNVPFPEGALIYCDIPYRSTNCGKYQGFDHERFYAWAVEQQNIYISEYDMPEDFIRIASIKKQVLSAANGNSSKSTESIFTNRKTYESMTSEQKKKLHYKDAKQLTLFDYMINGGRT